MTKFRRKLNKLAWYETNTNYWPTTELHKSITKRFRRKLNKLGKWPTIISTFLLVFSIGLLIGDKATEDYYDKKYANPVITYYITNPILAKEDKIINATDDSRVYVEGDTAWGYCYPIK